jgi:putative hemolysin
LDSTSRIILILILITLIVFSGLFSASETALMALSKSKVKMKRLKDEEVKGIDKLTKIMDDPNKLLSTILIGNNIVNIGASSIATSLFMDMFGASGVPIATAIMTLTVLIFGEITPKSIATHYPEKVSLLVLNMISIATFIFKPFVFLLDKIRDMIFKIFRIDSEIDNDAITEETLKTLVEVSHEEGLIEEEKKEIINNVFEFGEMVAKEAMINRMDVIGVDKTISHREIIEIFKEQKFTRMPIYDENIDSIIGIINVKDIAFLSDEEIENFDITNYSRDAFFTYEFKSVSTLLEEMKAKKTHMSVVVDEYGGTAGILTIENLVEQIVGDIEDEHDAEEADSGIVTISENEFVVKGSVHLSDINDKTGLELESENFDSIGGFIIDNLEGFPKANEVISIENTDYIIEDVDKNKINRIKIKIKNIGEGAMA